MSNEECILPELTKLSPVFTLPPSLLCQILNQLISGLILNDILELFLVNGGNVIVGAEG